MTDPRENLPSASAMPRYFKCGAAFLLEQSVKEKRKDTKDALTGRKTHKLINNPPEEYDSVGQEYTVERSLELRQEAVEKSGLIDAEDAEIIKDKRLWLRNTKLIKIFSGEFDYMVISKSMDTALVYDDKTLYGDHGEAKSNEQLISYAVLVYYIHKVKNIVIALGQPNLPLHRQLTMCRFDEPALKAAEERLRTKLVELYLPDNKIVPGKYCDFCDYALHCIPAQKRTFEIVNQEHDITLPTSPEILDNIRMAKAVLKRIEEQENAKAMIQIREDPENFPGYHVSTGKKTVEAEAGGCWAILKDDLTVNQFTNACKLSLSKLTIPYQKAMGISSQKKARAALEERLKDHIIISHGDSFIQKG